MKRACGLVPQASTFYNLENYSFRTFGEHELFTLEEAIKKLKHL